jgi:hypothetical protein
MKKKIYQKNYFVCVMVIQSSVLRVILRWDIPFVYSNRECTQLKSQEVLTTRNKGFKYSIKSYKFKGKLIGLRLESFQVSQKQVFV